MINSIFDLRTVDFLYSSTTDTTVTYTKYLEGIKWEVIEDSLEDKYIVKRNLVVKYSSGEFKEVVQYLKQKNVI